MKILILHLSDLHIRDKYTISTEKINKLGEAVSQFRDKIDECIIVLSGDIVFSGKCSQYGVAKYLLGKFISIVSDKLNIDTFIQILVVPGNHDMNYDNVKIKSQDIEDWFSVNSKELLYNDSSKGLDEFYLFASRKHCFTDCNIFLHKKILQFGTLKMRVNLINSAIFSTLDNDKGLHYIPENSIEELYLTENEDNDKCNIVLTIMHHNYEWFAECIKGKLEEALYAGTSILLVGHEHNPRCFNNKYTDVNSNLCIIDGGVLDDVNKSSFNIAVIDTDINKIQVKKYAWKSKEVLYGFYKEENNSEYVLSRKKCRKDWIYPKPETIKAMQEDKKYKITKNILDYYIFPRLEKDDDTKKDMEICDLDSFIKTLEKENYLLIKGYSDSGKSIFAQYIFLNFSKNGKIPIIFYGDDFSKRKLNTIIKTTFIEQYGDNNYEYDRFLQVAKEKRIAVIDDFDKINSDLVEDVIANIFEEFGKVIILSQELYETDIVKKAQEKYILDSRFNVYTLTEFYSDKRLELIKKIISVKISKELENKDNKEDIAKDIENFISNQIRLFNRNPDFIIQYVLYFIKEAGECKNNNYDIFNMVFEHNIMTAIQNEDKSMSVNTYFYVLDELAYVIHFEKKYPLKQETFNSIIEQYNIDYDQNINSKTFFEVLKKSKILEEGNGWNIVFSNNNYLAFFVARKLSRLYTSDVEKAKKAIEDVIENICFGINGNILLFLSYIKQHTGILDYVYNAAFKYIDNWDEFNFEDDNYNISYIEDFRINKEVKAPDDDERKQIKRSKIKAESQISVVQESKDVDIYKYDDESKKNNSYQLSKAMQLLRLIAATLPNFSYMLLATKKENIVHMIYSYTNKIIYRWFNEVDKNFDNLIEYIWKSIKEIKIDENENMPSKNDLKIFFQDYTIASILALYKDIASVSVNKDTINLFDKYKNDNNNTYNIQNLIMEEQVGRIESFLKKVDNLHQHEKPLLKTMVLRIIRSYLLLHEDLDKERERYLKQKYLTDEVRKDILLTKVKRING
ncbi:metallophosphoesterase [Pectinatus sottacetonis]|uniref:metallophosphoesterase n=1 Tax=Pectinatus sottacetonis TaxID=1002795 RepID=UPI0018C6CD0C|nr:metallophosphoesterase [Pectinatus sottacetonis]